MNNGRAKVLHIITRLDPGGSATNTLISVDRLREHGFDTELAYGATADRQGSLRERLAAIAVPTTYFPDLVRNVAPLHDLRAFLQVCKLCRREQYDLIHTHSSKGGAIGRFAAWICGIPVIHTPHGHIYYGYFNRVITSVFVRVERFFAGRTAKIVSLTDKETKDSMWLQIGKESQYCTIPSGVPLAYFQDLDQDSGNAFRKEHDIPTGAFLFVTSARLVEIKGIDTLIKAFAKCAGEHQNTYLAIAGDGDLRDEMQSLAADLAIADRVRFTGHVEDVRPLLSAANAFALASRNEGMGRSYIEAMAAGLPVIGTDVGGVSSFIEDGVTGLMVSPDDPNAFGAAMIRLADDPALCDRIAEAGAERVYPEYDESTMIQKLAELYREVLGRN